MGINLSIPLKILCLCSRNNWVDAVEEKNRDTGEILSDTDTDTAEDAYCTKHEEFKKAYPLSILPPLKISFAFTSLSAEEEDLGGGHVTDGSEEVAEVCEDGRDCVDARHWERYWIGMNLCGREGRGKIKRAGGVYRRVPTYCKISFQSSSSISNALKSFDFACELFNHGR